MSYRRPSSSTVRRLITSAAVVNGIGAAFALAGHPAAAVVLVAIGTGCALTILRYLVRQEGR